VKISKVFTYELRNDAHFQYYTEFRGLVLKTGADVLGIALMFAAWLPLYKREDAAYFAIRERINALVVVNGPEAYEAFIRTLNTVIDKYNAVVHARHGRKHHKPETAGNEEPEVPEEEVIP